jgi:hypothetical protein
MEILIEELLCARAQNAALRARIDAIFSTLFEFLSLTSKYCILSTWVSDPRRDAKSRWLKAISIESNLIKVDQVLAYWRVDYNAAAAKLLAYQAPPDLLAEELPALVQHCNEGWIIAKAALRATTVSEEVMQQVEEKLPATYIYICAKLGRSITHEMALDLFYRTDPEEFSGGRGLAAWAIGYMGMWNTLEEIRKRVAPA